MYHHITIGFKAITENEEPTLPTVRGHCTSRGLRTWVVQFSPGVRSEYSPIAYPCFGSHIALSLVSVIRLECENGPKCWDVRAVQWVKNMAHFTEGPTSVFHKM